MSKVREKIKLTSYDELLKVETTDGLKEIDVDKLHDFSNHPFKVSDDEKMEELTESIRERGVLLPILVRKTNDEEYDTLNGWLLKSCNLSTSISFNPSVISTFNNSS